MGDLGQRSRFPWEIDFELLERLLITRSQHGEQDADAIAGFPNF
jgi:hypothetical protein